jgi:hypothetical protein
MGLHEYDAGAGVIRIGVQDGAVCPHFAFKCIGLLEMAGGGINLEIDRMMFALFVIHCRIGLQQSLALGPRFW